jgi:hypothetical protein
VLSIVLVVQVLPPSLECETVGTMFDWLESMILSGNALSGVGPVCTDQEQSAEGQPATDRSRNNSYYMVS